MAEIIFDSKKASQYEDLARKAVFGYDQLFTMVLSLLSDQLNESANVLVIGCGTGMELTTFGNRMPNWKMTGVDPSEEMIKLSQSRVDELGLSDRVMLHHGFTETLPEDEIYDGATLMFVMRFIHDEKRKLTLLKDIAKRLRTGAKFVLVDQHGDLSSKHFQCSLKAWQNFMRLSGVPSKLVNRIAAQAMGQSFFTEYEIEWLLSRAGFNNITRFYDAFFHSGWIAQK